MAVELRQEHRWLERLVGDWTFEGDATMQPGDAPTSHTGTEHVRPLGGAWVVCEMAGDPPGGGTGRSVMLLGFDPARDRFVGTFASSELAFLWLYEGTLDEAGRVLTLDTEGPSFSGDGGMARYRDLIELDGDGRRTLRSLVQGADGAWTEFMVVRYRRAA